MKPPISLIIFYIAVVVSITAVISGFVALDRTRTNGDLIDGLAQVQRHQIKVGNNLRASFFDACQRLNVSIGVNRDLAQFANDGLRSIPGPVTVNQATVIAKRQALRRQLGPLNCTAHFKEIQH